MLEVCVDNLDSAVNSIHGGADELEVCSSLAEGGLTPSAGLVTQIMQMVNNITYGKPINETCFNCACDKLTKKPKVNVMIRCRTGSDFCYTHYEMVTMLSDIDIFKGMNVDRFVFGALTEKQEICNINNKRVIDKTFPIPVTFHRAFDVTKDPIVAIEKVIELGFTRLLTSGQRPSASDVDAVQLIKHLTQSYGNKIVIMPGAGVNFDNGKIFIDAGCKIVHSSCKVVKYLPRVEKKLSMGTSDSEYLYVTDENIVKKLKYAINT